MTECHSVRDCRSPVSLFLQLSLVATLRRVKIGVVGLLDFAVAAKIANEFDRVFLHKKLCFLSARAGRPFSEATAPKASEMSFSEGPAPSFFRV